MTFTKIATQSPTEPNSLNHTNANNEHDLWRIFQALRDVRSHFGLKPAHLQTLQAMISFLKPGQGETVFASNREICRRAGGVDERTIRRHINRFIEAGLFSRNDSPNRKRYRVRSTRDYCVSFGISLEPLLKRASEIFQLEELIHADQQDCKFLRKQILQRLALIDEAEPDNSFTNEVRKLLRRKLDLSKYVDLFEKVDALVANMSTAVDVVEAEELSANNGQTVRHHSKSVKEKKDKDNKSTNKRPKISLLTKACKQACTFSTETPKTWEEAEKLAQTLGPMIGLHPAELERASKKVGSVQTITALFVTIQLAGSIRNHLAYFLSLTLGRRAKDFDPVVVLKRMTPTNEVAA